MLKVAICDDEYVIASQIENILCDICQRESIRIDIDVFYSGIALEKEVLRGEKYDLLYLDIQMENGDGITAASNIRKLDENAIIIFVSGHDKYVMELFRLDVFAFIKKPIDSIAFSKTFLEANQKICSKNFYFTFHYKNQEYKLPCKDIIYFESKGRQISIHTRNDGIYVFNGKLSDVEKRLQEGKNPFLRIHQSFLVNYHLIKAKSKTEVTLITDIKLPISEDRKKEFSRDYGRLLGGEIDV